MTLTDLVTMLGRWEDGSGPLYVQLASALRRLLESGHLASGTVLPPERRLSAALSVSRNTVSAAYAELRADGWIDARQGSGTTVTTGRHSPVAAFKASGLFATLLRHHPDVIDLTVAVPGAAPVVTEVLAHPDRFAAPLDDVISGHGYFPRGYPPLREALATLLTRNGLPTEAEQLIVTSGAQQAIALAVQATVRSGDRVLVEEVTFPGALDTVMWRDGTSITVPSRDGGIDVDAFERRARSDHPRLAYVIPTFNNPTGSVLEGARRSHLARIIASVSLTTIDDLTLAELDHTHPAPPPLAALEPSAPIVSVGSLSKVFWGGLRVGWLRAHQTVIDHLAGLKASADMGSSAPTQAMALPMLDRYDETRAWRKGQLVRSLEAAIETLATELPSWTWTTPAGGPHLWLRLPEGDATAFAHLALRHGVAVVPGPMLAVDDGTARDRIRLPLYRTPEELSAAIARLSSVWRTFRRAAGPDSPPREKATDGLTRGVSRASA